MEIQFEILTKEETDKLKLPEARYNYTKLKASLDQLELGYSIKVHSEKLASVKTIRSNVLQYIKEKNTTFYCRCSIVDNYLIITRLI